MKTRTFLLLSLASMLFFVSCSKDKQAPAFTFTNTVMEGQANANGEYTISGTLTSEVNLSKVTLTKEGQNNPFLVDDSEAKNKNTYSFSYPVTGINSNTYILIAAHDQNGGQSTAKFLIRK
ncbi:MAG TPA: hypothetical protein VGB71_09200 [Flavisolibacter sp.]